ncbi:class II myosin [Massospora cicadina]|nr:class II myosin [Massospora cicadina]
MPPKKADWSESFKRKHVGVNDMTLLSKVDDEAINGNLEARFVAGDIYVSTYIGHVLISVNPFKDLGLYTDQILRSYVGKNRLEMPPHVFAIAEGAYYNLKSYKESQCIIISGESGAGKTEAAKKIMSYIASVSGGNSEAIQHVKDMVLATNPLLESFGCAKTLRNNNSSRHGKYLEIQFNADGEPTGAHITNYLLEKNRVISQIADERNFHIFYQFCRGATQEYKDLFGINGPESYAYTSQSGCLDVDGVDDVEEYQATLEAMRVIGLTDDEQHGIHRVLATILWLGNTTFTEGDNGNSFIVDQNVTDFIGYLLEVDSNVLEKTLVTRVMETQRGGRRGSVYDVPLNPDQASAVRDGLAKALYDQLFEWIVKRINQALKQRGKSDTVIGVLDIYGFEIFDFNSFEQLCINYVNEKLQQIFIELTLKAEQEEYVKERIQWTPIKFFDNKIVCDLIEEKRPPGIFAALNDACATAHADPQAADASFIQRLGLCAANPHLEQRGAAFVVSHYAGDVKYEVRGMTEKNRDQLSKDILTLVKASGSRFIQGLFPDPLDLDSKRRPPTASDRIKSSAGALVANLMRAQPSYIRCIKPNATKSPKAYERAMVLHQVKYLGLCENVRVRRAGFASRQTFEKFVERFFLLSKKTSYAGEYTWGGDARSGTEVILREVGIPPEEWQLGVTKAFIRHPETLWSLESLRDKYWHNMAARIQRAWRRLLAYRHACATKIQRCFRKNKAQLLQLRVRDAGHALLASRKERRRFSLLSMRRFHGDYLDVNLPPGAALRSAATMASDERALFSGKVQLLIPRPLRSSKLSPRVLIATAKALYILVTVVEKKLAQIKLERKVPLISIDRASVSTLRDDWLVLHVQGDVDLVLSTPFKTELCTHLNTATRNQLTLHVVSSIEYAKKSNKVGTIKFIKDEAQVKYDVYKNHVVTVGSGQPPGSVSDPPCARITPAPNASYNPKPVPKTQRQAASQPTAPSPQPSRQVPPPPSHPRYQAIYDFTAEGGAEGSFKKDDVFEILQKDENGWWLGLRDGVQSWVPSNYLQELSPPPQPAPRSPQGFTRSDFEPAGLEPARSDPPRPAPKPRPAASSSPSPIPRKTELDARQLSHHRTLSNQEGTKPSSIPSRPTSNQNQAPTIPTKPSTLGASSVAQLASALNGSLAAPTIPPKSNAEPPATRPRVPSRPAAPNKPKPPPRPPLPSRR